jgi:regulator of protease activity HflC (stomatin/prohibitin superfamily)
MLLIAIALPGRLKENGRTAMIVPFHWLLLRCLCRAPEESAHVPGDYRMDFTQGLMFLFYAVIALFVLGTILSGFYQVKTAEAIVIQRMGKFNRVANAGINFKLPWLDQIAGRIDLRVQQLALDVETKTKDNVFVKMPVSVQYHVIPEKVYEAFYKLANPKQQISSYVFNVILGHVPKMNLDDAFLQQSDIAIAIKRRTRRCNADLRLCHRPSPGHRY